MSMNDPPSRSPTPDSVVYWFEQMRAGDERASSELWDRFFERLAAEARSKMNRRQRRVTDEDDLAAGVLHSLVTAAASDQLPKINSRDDLWRMLLTWIRHDIVDHIRQLNRDKRGGGKVRGDSVFKKEGDSSGAGFDQVMGDEDAAEALLDLQDAWVQFSTSLEDDTLRAIALLVLEGKTQEEIAQKMKVSPRTVTRKICLIRQLWQEQDISRS